MPNTPSFREELISQIPALQLLIGLGYEYLTPNDYLSKHHTLLEELTSDFGKRECHA